MDEKEFSGFLDTSVSENKGDSLYPVYFGVSCGFFALQVMSKPDFDDERWSEIRDNILQGSAQLLGLLVWKAQKEGVNGGKSELLYKLDSAEREIQDLKRMRHEDAKANEKVVGIFAAQEQIWLLERKKLRQHIGALINELRVFDKNKEEAISDLNEKLKEMELFIQSKDRVLEEEEQKRKELEEKLVKAENDAEELRESAKVVAEEQSAELRKHKTAFIELVSNQRQLEAEMGRALKQVEATKQELNSVLEEKEESELVAQKLSMEIVKMHKDLEQKEKTLSAMLRKSKLDTAEKQMLLKEIKLLKAKRKQAELETERWRTVSESRHERQSLRSMLMNSVSSRVNVIPSARGMQSNSIGSSHIGREPDAFSPLSDPYSTEGNDDLAINANVKHLEGWVRSEAEKYATLLEQRHHLELDAFAEQMRLKGEKLEALRWRLLSMELESNRLRSHVEGLNKDNSKRRHDNIKLEALLVEREEQLTSLKEQFASQLKSLNCQKTNLNSSPHSSEVAQESNSSKAKVIKRIQEEIEQERKDTSVEEVIGKEEPLASNQSHDVTLELQSPDSKEFEEERHVINKGNMQNESTIQLEDAMTENLALQCQDSNKTDSSPWRMDLHGVGVSYKIKRLKQQLLMLERLTGKQDSVENVASHDDGKISMKGFLSLSSLLNKQVVRYHSLQGKTDDLCKRMHGNDLYANRGDSSSSRAKEKTRTLEHFLDETFQLQRYLVATGQKLIEIQSKIASGCKGIAEEMEKNANIDMNRFADSIKTLFQEVQRGLQVRIARIIGDLEGTLACEGMKHLRR
ncbi:Ribonuclease P protein subunit P38-related isoform 1 [Quillaja saponaria]|uniref:Ribonuclease P protein subunit P38-related isoform 1 n=1 Tax=Quillaja saponaria TaxID=32244 RepID=A0AAD7LVY0_QUISA|nr:Ribonuclease P protein subunit P38-related isoform 1 [Quillaja saponaria]